MHQSLPLVEYKGSFTLSPAGNPPSRCPKCKGAKTPLCHECTIAKEQFYAPNLSRALNETRERLNELTKRVSASPIPEPTQDLTTLEDLEIAVLGESRVTSAPITPEHARATDRGMTLRNEKKLVASTTATPKKKAGRQKLRLNKNQTPAKRKVAGLSTFQSKPQAHSTPSQVTPLTKAHPFSPQDRTTISPNLTQNRFSHLTNLPNDTQDIINHASGSTNSAHISINSESEQQTIDQAALSPPPPKSQYTPTPPEVVITPPTPEVTITDKSTTGSRVSSPEVIEVGFQTVTRSKKRTTPSPTAQQAPVFSDVVVSIIRGYASVSIVSVLEEFQKYLGGRDNCVSVKVVGTGPHGKYIHAKVRTPMLEVAKDFKYSKGSIEVKVETGIIFPSRNAAPTKQAPTTSATTTSTKAVKTNPKLSRGVLTVPNSPTNAWVPLVKQQNANTVKHISKPYNIGGDVCVTVTFKGDFVPKLQGYDGIVAPDTLREIRCNKCQKFGHRTVKCKGTTKCPQCSDRHTHSDCTKGADARKCPNCDGAHSAAYKGCPTYKDYSAGIIQQNMEILAAHQAICAGLGTANPQTENLESPIAPRDTNDTATHTLELSVLVELSRKLANKSAGEIYKTLNAGLQTMLGALAGN